MRRHILVSALFSGVARLARVNRWIVSPMVTLVLSTFAEAQPLEIQNGGQPTRISVRLYPATEELRVDGEPTALLTADLQGRVVVPVAMKEWIAVIDSPGSATALVSRPFPEKIILVPGRSLRVTLLGGRGPEQGRVSWRIDSKHWLSVGTNAHGVAQIDGLPLHEVDALGMIGSLTRSTRLAASARETLIHVRPTLSISGRVLDPAGRGVAGARVRVLRDAPYAFREAVSSENGGFEIRDVLVGESHMEILALGWRNESVAISLDPGKDIVLPPVYLTPESEVTGRILNESTGEPVPGARLVLESPEASPAAVRDLLEGPTYVLTNGDGVFRLRGARPGPLQAAVDAPGLARTRLPRFDVPSEGVLDLGVIAIGSGTSLSVLVRDLHEQPVVALPLSIDRGPAIAAGSALDGETDATGRAMFRNLGRGRYRLRIGGSDRPGLGGPRRLTWVDVDGSVSEEEITVSLATASLRLGVRQAFAPGSQLPITVSPAVMDVQPQEGAPIRVVRGDVVRIFNKPVGGVKAGLTDERGDIQLDDVDVGDVRVDVHLGPSQWSSRISLSGVPTRHEIRIPPSILPVTVIGESGPLAGAHVRVEYADGVRLEGETIADGSVLLLGSQAGPAALVASAPKHRERRVTVASPEAPQTVVLDPEADGPSLRVTVTARSGEVVSGALVTALHRGSLDRRSAASDDIGVAHLRGLPSGPTRLIVSREPFAPATAIALNLDEHRVVETVVVLEHGHLVEIVAPTSSGKVPFSIIVRDNEGNPINSLMAAESALVVEPEKTATIGPLSSGRYSVELRSGEISKRRDFEVADEPLRVEIR